jgi:hypothetical protein
LQLSYLGDLLAEQGPEYGSFRDQYKVALTAMRANLAGKRAPERPEPTVVANDNPSPHRAAAMARARNEENGGLYTAEPPDDE